MPIEDVWLELPSPALLVRGGELVAVNAAAATLFPAAGPEGAVSGEVPGWLVAAHREHRARRGEPPVSRHRVEVGHRSFLAHPVDLPDGAVLWWLTEDSDVRRARDELRRERARTALLDEVSAALLSSLNGQRCREVIAQMAATHLADGALVITPTAAREHLVTSCPRGGTPVSTAHRVDTAAVDGLVNALRGLPARVRWSTRVAALAAVAPEGFGPLGAVAVLPLTGHGTPAGALVLLSRAGRPEFDEADDTFARLFAARAGAALSAARMFAREAAITDTLMRELLPPALGIVDGVEYAGRYQASQATEHVGGDFYDLHGAAPGGQTLVVLGDVCGKGLGAAVLTARVRTALHTLKHMADDHLGILTLLNDALIRPQNTRFVTLVLASVVRTGERVRVRLSSAGHLPPLLVRNSGFVEQVATSGTLIGVFPKVRTKTCEVVLEPGETCLLYTDGVTEARGGPLGGDVMLGEQRLREALAGCAGMPAEAITERVHMLAAEWVGRGGHDDIAVLAITAPRRRPPMP